MPRGVWVTGHARSGTSMTAGLFREHGTFFGACKPATKYNPKGFLEHTWLRERLHDLPDNDWPGSWFRQLEREGWGGETPWGFKSMPMHWAVVRALKPSAVVLCYRPEADIVASCHRVGWTDRSIATVRNRWATMERIKAEAPCPVYRVDAPRLIAGDLRQMEEPMRALGLELDPAVAREWIEPDYWHGD